MMLVAGVGARVSTCRTGCPSGSHLSLGEWAKNLKETEKQKGGGQAEERKPHVHRFPGTNLMRKTVSLHKETRHLATGTHRQAPSDTHKCQCVCTDGHRGLQTLILTCLWLQAFADSSRWLQKTVQTLNSQRALTGRRGSKGASTFSQRHCAAKQKKLKKMMGRGRGDPQLNSTNFLALCVSSGWQASHSEKAREKNTEKRIEVKPQKSYLAK